MKRLMACALITCCALAISCTKENEQDLMNAGGGGTPACDTVNMKYTANVVPILSNNCYGCHGNGSAMGGISLETYASVRPLATSGTLLGAITHASGYSPMPKNAAKLSDCDINKIRSWINRGALNN